MLSFLYLPLFYLITLLSPEKANTHAFYISTIKIEHQEGVTTIVSIKVYSDDLQNAIKDEFALTALPRKSVLCETKSEFLHQYFKKYLQLWVNEQAQVLTFRDCEQINDVHLLRFEVQSPAFWKSFRIKADFLMVLFPTQSNMLQLYYSKKQIELPQTYFGRMTKGNEMLEFNLEAD